MCRHCHQLQVSKNVRERKMTFSVLHVEKAKDGFFTTLLGASLLIRGMTEYVIGLNHSPFGRPKYPFKIR